MLDRWRWGLLLKHSAMIVIGELSTETKLLCFFLNITIEREGFPWVCVALDTKYENRAGRGRTQSTAAQLFYTHTCEKAGDSNLVNSHAKNTYD